MAELTLVEAVNDALHTELERDPDVMVLGEDVGRAGGVFRATAGLRERRVDATVRAEAVEQARSRSENAAGAAHVLAEHHHVGVARELRVERVVDRLDERQLSHGACSPAGRRTHA